MASDRTIPERPHGRRKPLLIAVKAASILLALALTIPLGFLLIGIPGFMLATTGTDPDERLEYGFWFVQWMNIPVLLTAIWLTAIGIVVKRGKLYWGTVGGAWLLSVSFFLLGLAILRDFGEIGAALIGNEPVPIIDSPPAIFRSLP